MRKLLDRYYFLIILLILVFIVLSSYLFGKRIDKKIMDNSKYTIGIMTSDWHHKNNRGVGTDFEYYVNGFTYNRTGQFNLKKGERCLIMYDSLKPKNYIMLGKHKISDTVKIPYNGWKFNEIPIPIDSADLKQYFEKLGLDD